MRKVKWNPLLSGVCAVLGGMLLWASAARADVTSTNAAAILVFPKVRVDTTTSTTHLIDTEIQLTNTSSNPVNVRCFYVNANGHCSNAPSISCDPSATGVAIATRCESQFAACFAGWQETDFAFRLTGKQPIEWRVGEGLATLPLNDAPSGGGQFNSGSIPPAPENPMVGELKCVEVGDDELPIDSNDLKGEATIEDITTTATPSVSVDSRSYNGIGIEAITGQNNRDNTLVIGQEYNACPAVLIVDHFFDDAVEPSAAHDTVRSDLTLVPCSEDFNFQQPITTVVQFLVFNEFEQRFSTSRSVKCFSELVLSDIDTRPGTTDDGASIFNVNVEGTLTGQTQVRGVADADTTHGHGLLGIVEEFHRHSDGVTVIHSAAFNIHQRGTRTQPDIVLLPGAGVP